MIRPIFWCEIFKPSRALTALWLLLSQSVFCQSLALNETAYEIAKAVGRSLPSASVIAAGHNLNVDARFLKLVAVGGFADGEKRLVTHRSKAIADFAAVQLQGVCDAFLITPSYYARRDLRGEFQETAPSAEVVRQRIKHRISAKFILTGALKDTAQALEIAVSVINTATSEESVFDTFSVAKDGIEFALTERLQSFASTFCSDAKISGDPPGTIEALQRLIEMSDTVLRKEFTEIARQALARSDGSNALAVMHLVVPAKAPQAR